MSRTILHFLLALSALPTIAGGQQQRVNFDFETVSEEAAALILKSEPSPAPNLPKELQELDYDDYRKIRFRTSEALWWNERSPYHVEFFHPGHIFREPVLIYELSDSHVQEVPFLVDAFDYGDSSYSPGLFNTPLGYAGIRVKYPLNKKEVYDELIVFQGASYFRALGQEQVYGLSLRGLAMNTLGDSEDFPRFTKLWLKKPVDRNAPLRIYALLEGKKVTGAYEFNILPNGITQIDVHARLFFRDGGASEVGIAPITSMFVFGENTNRPFPDWRPEVHDSDGVLIHADQDWIWRPLENLAGRYSKKFPTGRLRGFGLVQRDRAFNNYQDLEAHYEKRPSAWVEPQGKWPTGSVVLYTFGTESEATDNVNLFWEPDLKAGQTGPVDLSYKISLRTKPPAHELAYVLETRVGQRTLDPNAHTVVIEFSRPETIEPNEIPQLSLGFDAGGLQILEEPVVQYNPIEDRIRAFIHLSKGPTSDKPIEMTAQLLREGHQISEKWSYAWMP